MGALVKKSPCFTCIAGGEYLITRAVTDRLGSLAALLVPYKGFLFHNSSFTLDKTNTKYKNIYTTKQG